MKHKVFVLEPGQSARGPDARGREAAIPPRQCAEPSRRHPELQRFVESAAFSPDGSRIVTASWDQTARIWDAASGKEIAVLRDRNLMSSAVFSPDGSHIVTASDDETARLWDARAARRSRSCRIIGRSLPLPLAPTGRASSRRQMTKRRASGTPRAARRSRSCAVISANDLPLSAAWIAGPQKSQLQTARLAVAIRTVTRIPHPMTFARPSLSESGLRLLTSSDRMRVEHLIGGDQCWTASTILWSSTTSSPHRVMIQYMDYLRSLTHLRRNWGNLSAKLSERGTARRPRV